MQRRDIKIQPGRTGGWKLHTASIMFYSRAMSHRILCLLFCSFLAILSTFLPFLLIHSHFSFLFPTYTLSPPFINLSFARISAYPLIYLIFSSVFSFLINTKSLRHCCLFLVRTHWYERFTVLGFIISGKRKRTNRATCVLWIYSAFLMSH
jgi:hypothetical protein